MSSMSILIVILWFGIAGTLYAYVGFPVLVAVLAGRSRRKPVPARDGRPAPGVTVIIPAYNEERNIEAKISNVLAADYPTSLLEIIVVSDASTDRTNEIARGFDSSGVSLIEQETRRGKTAGLNRALDVARGDLVIFTDANAEYPAETIGTLVHYFDDPASAWCPDTRGQANGCQRGGRSYQRVYVARASNEARREPLGMLRRC